MHTPIGNGDDRISTESEATRHDSLNSLLTVKQVRMARLLVASSATDVADCTELLTMLGLIRAAPTVPAAR